MNQIVDFNIKFYDIRTKKFTEIKNSDLNAPATNYILNINITRDADCNNAASISFINNEFFLKSYVSDYLKLFTYVSIEVEVFNNDGGTTTTQKLYFSGFVNDINKGNNFSPNGGFSATVVNIVDYSYLLKTTFFTKNLSYLDMLADFSTDFRLLNLLSYIGDPKNQIAITKNAYNPAEIILLMFAYFYVRFFKSMFYTTPKQLITKIGGTGQEVVLTGQSGLGNGIKDFKIFVPFCFTQDSYWAIWNRELMMMKEMNGSAFELFKYLAGSEFFEINIHEDATSVNLIIRPKPYMAIFSSASELLPVLIEDKLTDFGVEVLNKKKPSEILSGMKSWHSGAINDFNEAKAGVSIDSLYPSESAVADIINKYYGSETTLYKYIDVRKLTTLNLSKDHGSIYNIISTNPQIEYTTMGVNAKGYALSSMMNKLGFAAFSDSIKRFNTKKSDEDAAMSNREKDILKKEMKTKAEAVNSGFDEKFAKYIQEQFDGTSVSGNINPVFLMDYKGLVSKNTGKTVSGDINVFGIREFEAKLNYYGTGSIASGTLNSIINNFSENQSENTVEKNVSLLSDYEIKYIKSAIESSPTASRTMKLLKVNLDNKKTIKEIKDEIATKADRVTMGFIGRLNKILGFAFKDNEILYNGSFTCPIDVDIYQGQNFDIKDEDGRVLYRGYVNSVRHTIDFQNVSFMTSVAVSRVFDVSETDLYKGKII